MDGRGYDELYDQLEQTLAEARDSRRGAFEESVRRGKAEKDVLMAIRMDRRGYDELYDQLEQALAEARDSRRGAFEESVRRGKAEKDALKAIRMAKAAESVYNEELKRRKEIEIAALRREKAELENIVNRRDEVLQELRGALESQIADSNEIVKELAELSQIYKNKRDELQIERDNALQVAEELRQKQAELEKTLDQRNEVMQELRGALESQIADSNEMVKEDNALKVAEELRPKQAETSSSNLTQLISEFSFSEIEEATHSFDTSLKIGEGEGSIYKGLLRHTEVAIKMLHYHSLQGPSEYQQEVDILSKLRHPNLVTLIGACPEVQALIYEYLPNGSLEDRLNCKDNSSPLSWQSRICIAAELCSVLVFLHSSKPHGIVHGDLKPGNILLDANFVSKLSDFGNCRAIFRDENSSSNATARCRTNVKGTFGYIDPEFMQMGELTAKSDVYSFGIILLRLLTGRPALGITKEVQYALNNGNLKSLLDHSAGDWPYVQAQQLAHLALRCAEINRNNRPDLGSEVWRVLERMRASCGGASTSMRLGSEEQAPEYFICPISQEVMEDPHVAADGFTYEAEALRGWLDSGHDTSPMTNLQLAHTNLIPNLALRSAIQEWLEHQ